MAPNHIQTGGSAPLHAFVTDLAGAALEGVTDIKVYLWRTSDAKIYDWADDTFKASGWTTLKQALTELDATNRKGWYRLDNTSHPDGLLDTSAFTNAVADDTYVVTVIQDGGLDAGNVPQTSELQVGSYLKYLNEYVSVPATPAEVNTQCQAVVLANNLDKVAKTDPGAVPPNGTYLDQVLDLLNSIKVGGSTHLVKQAWSLNPGTDTLTGRVWVENQNLVVAAPVSMSVTWYSADGATMFTLTDAAPDAQGFFLASKTTPALATNTPYYCIAIVTITGLGDIKGGMGLFTIG